MKKNDPKNKIINNKNKNKPTSMVVSRRSKTNLEEKSAANGKEPSQPDNSKRKGTKNKSNNNEIPTGSVRKRTPGKTSFVKAKFVEGEEIEGVNNYKIVSSILQTTRPLMPDIYGVKDADQDEEYRLKLCTLELGILKKEAAILKRVAKVPGDKSFVQLIEYGTIAAKKLEFIVVSSFGLNLDQIIKKVTQSPLSIGCGLNVAIQVLKAIKDLHSCGFLHKNINPSSLFCGLGEKEATIYLQDFRAHRKFIDANKKTIAARPKVKRYGFARFCSRATQQEKDQGRKDDLESWLYTIFWLMDHDSLSWKKEKDIPTILNQKDAFMKNEKENEMFKNVPKELKGLIEAISPMTFDTEPDYEKLNKILQEAQTSLKSTDVCDWVGKSVNGPMDGETKNSADNKMSGEGEINIRITKKKKGTRKKLSPGDIIKNADQKTGWKNVCLLGSGGFGDVYKVHREGASPDKCYALKTESEEGEKRLLRLKIEVTVMMKTSDKEKKFEHFIEFVDRGKCEELRCKFVVMGLVGPSLEDIRRKYVVSNFTKHTCFNVFIQTVIAVRDLHSLGFLHRDIKPANYAVGLNEFESVVYMLDFGIAKSYLDADGKHKTPRKKVKFLGTLRFAARACLKQVEQGRKDDLECWIYMLFDLIDDVNGLPWKRLSDAKAILKSKEKFFSNEFPEVYKRMPKGMYTLLQYVNNLEHESVPDYEYIQTFLKTCAKDNGIKPEKKLDWIGKLKKKAFESESEKSDQKNSGEDSE
ncbi:unnamed protein product [Caenorhabditis angaria]|uniref:Protein kinase domain-containing protein n=1 Tax=Caenorhabditis angaria TaxID=860376 RepID=A0A9P1IJF9_9PELO|nr:unnamed protein product [Caenorhabditis angaria]